ncbi:hypothetical protein F4604DRAFT_1901480 [Suillus subluteus]|nr:hypothetical protein F4604DRAFT_1901480 [Suillus subluteus]
MFLSFTRFIIVLLHLPFPTSMILNIATIMQWLDLATNIKNATTISFTLEAQFVFQKSVSSSTLCTSKSTTQQITPGDGISKPAIIITAEKSPYLRDPHCELKDATMSHMIKLLEEIFALGLADRVHKKAFTRGWAKPVVPAACHTQNSAGILSSLEAVLLFPFHLHPQSLFHAALLLVLWKTSSSAPTPKHGCSHISKTSNQLVSLALTQQPNNGEMWRMQIQPTPTSVSISTVSSISESACSQLSSDDSNSIDDSEEDCSTACCSYSAVPHEHNEDLTRFSLSASIGAGDGRPPPPPYEFATDRPVVFVQNGIVVRLGQGQANNARQR